MVETEQLALSKAIHRRTGSTFYAATKLLPTRVRHPTYVLYAFFRTADEVVDGANGMPPEKQQAELERFRAAVLGEAETDHPVLLAFREVRRTNGIDERHVHTFIDAMLADVETHRYETYVDLEAYMRGSAAAVGEMMTCVMDPDEPERARPHARALGEAFQLTNFLRDVREDIVERNRIYIPRATLSRFGVAEEEIERLQPSARFARAIEYELRRAEELYEVGVAGIEYLPVDCQLPVLTAAVLYADHHRLIRALDCDVLTTEPSLTRRRLLSLALRVRWHWLWSSNPADVFERVSAVPKTADHSPGRLDQHVPTR